MAIGFRGLPQRGRPRGRRRVPRVRAVLPGGTVVAVPRGAGARSGRAAGVRPALAHAARILRRRLLLRAPAGHLRRAAAAGGRFGQSGLRPPAGGFPDAARRLRAGPRRSRRPGGAGRGRRGPHAPAGAVGRPGRGPVAVGSAAADHAGGAARAAAARLRAAAPGVRQAADREPRPAVPAGRVRPGLGHRLLARAADAHAAVRRGTGQDLRLPLRRR